jgi:hypothetical protein
MSRDLDNQHYSEGEEYVWRNTTRRKI